MFLVKPIGCILCNLVMSFSEGPNIGPDSSIVKDYTDASKYQVRRYRFIPMLMPRRIRCTNS